MNPLARLVLSSALLLGAVAAHPARQTPRSSDRDPFVQTTICRTSADCGQGVCSQTLEVGPAQHDENCPKSIGSCKVTFTVSCPETGCEARSTGVVCCNSSQAITATCNGRTYEADPRNTWGTVGGGECDSVEYGCS